MIFIPVLLSVGISAWLLVGRGAFWRSGPVLGMAHPTRPLKVTVVIPARDEVEHISDTLRSLLTQQFDGELRIVVVDDNSSDGTGALTLELAETDGRLRVVDGAPLQTALRDRPHLCSVNRCRYQAWTRTPGLACRPCRTPST